LRIAYFIQSVETMLTKKLDILFINELLRPELLKHTGRIQIQRLIEKKKYIHNLRKKKVSFLVKTICAQRYQIRTVCNT
jgi:hypothetical protein